MRLLAHSATKPSTTQKADFVPGHKIGQLIQRSHVVGFRWIKLLSSGRRVKAHGAEAHRAGSAPQGAG
jgi:hypothetical protein